MENDCYKRATARLILVPLVCGWWTRAPGFPTFKSPRWNQIPRPLSSPRTIRLSNKIQSHKPGTGMNGKRAVVEVGFHSLRHTFVSLCRESNVSVTGSTSG
jgi:integrase